MADTGGANDSAGPYVAGIGRLIASRYAAVDGFVARSAGGAVLDAVGVDGTGREFIATELAALELRQGRRLGDPECPLRLTVQAVPRSLEVPIIHAGASSYPGVSRNVIADDVRSIDALLDALRSASTAPDGPAVVVTVRLDERTTTFAGTLLTRDAHDGSVTTHGSWATADGLGAPDSTGGAPPPHLRDYFESVAAAAEAACADMCAVSVAVVDGVPLVFGITPAARTPRAALRVAVDLRDLGLISEGEALRRVSLSVFSEHRAGDALGSPTTDASRVLRWASKSPQVEIVAPGHAPWPTVTCPADVEALDASTTVVVVEPAAGPVHVHSEMRAIADALTEHGVDQVTLVPTDVLRAVATTAIPDLPWQGVVGTPDDPAIRVLAARLARAAGDA